MSDIQPTERAVPSPSAPFRSPPAASPSLVAAPLAPAPVLHAPPATAARPEVAADEAVLAELSSELDAVEAALHRLDGPSAAKCELCGGDIERETLIADPLTPRCTSHRAAPADQGRKLNG